MTATVSIWYEMLSHCCFSECQGDFQYLISVFHKSKHTFTVISNVNKLKMTHTFTEHGFE